MSKTENPPAFPSMGLNPWKQQIVTDPGMSLRDWFAGQAMGGMCAYHASYGVGHGPGEISKRAYEIADTMLFVRLSGDEKP